MDHIDFDKIYLKIFVGISELIVIISYALLSLFTGIILFFVRKYIYKALNWIGVSYFNYRLTNIRHINSDLIWCQGVLQADSYGLFRTYNGKSYVCDTFPLTDTGRAKISNLSKIVIRKVNSKPEDFFPEYLEVDVYNTILENTLQSDWKVFSYDKLKSTDSNSSLLVFLEENGIECLMTFRIWDKEKKTYGLIFFTWSKEPNIDLLFTRNVSKKLDSVSIRFQSHIDTSVLEKFMRVQI